MFTISKTTNFRITLSICLILLLVFGAFSSCLKNGFVNWDDDRYLGNPVTAQPFSLMALKEASTTFFIGHYQPLTILSYVLNYQFFKLNPLGYHLTNLILHLLNS